MRTRDDELALLWFRYLEAKIDHVHSDVRHLGRQLDKLTSALGDDGALREVLASVRAQTEKLAAAVADAPPTT